MMRSIAGLVVACVAVLSSCGTQEYANVPPAIAEDCEREVAMLADRETLPAEDDPLRGPAGEAAPDPIEDARTAQGVAGAAGLDTWPEEALLYRCFTSRGVELTPEQAEMLAEWDKKPDADSSNRSERSE